MGTSGIIKAKLGYYGNFILGICMITICLIYAIFFLKVGTMVHGTYFLLISNIIGFKNIKATRGSKADGFDEEERCSKQRSH